MRICTLSSLVLVVTMAGSHFASAVPAFPEAQGGGAASVGGRGGQVIEVTNLNDSGPGSLRAAMETSGARMVVFRVGGTIWLNTAIRITSPYITVAGQTAPGGGIELAGKYNPEKMVNIYAHDVTLRYMRIRSGANASRPPGSQSGNPIMIGSDFVVSNVIADHVSLSWTTDEQFTIWSNSGSGVVHDVTLSWALVGEGLAGHGVGTITGNTTGRADETLDLDYHHNLWIDHTHRLPLLKNKSTRYVNNITYNYSFYAAQALGGISVDFIGNKFKLGPLDPGPIHEFQFSEVDSGDGPVGTPSVYLSGNIGPHNSNPSGNQWVMAARVTGENGNETGTCPPSFQRSTPLTGPFPIIADSASDLDSIMLPTIGASRRLDENGDWVLNRDAVDVRLVGQYQNGTGGIPTTEDDVGGFPTIDPGTPYADSDHDGMPDSYELAHGFNPNDPSDGPTIAADGFSNLEHFLDGMSTTPPSSLTCSITSPASGTDFSAPADITINATASDTGGIVTNVEFYQGAVKLGSDSTSPYSYTWTNVAAGSYSLTVKAYNNLGSNVVSTPASITVTAPAPTWENHPFANQNDSFTADFDAVPSQVGSDVTIGLSTTTASSATELACIVRFNDANQIDARNGAIYAAQTVVGYAAGSNCHFRLVVNVPQHTYDVDVTPAGGSPMIIGQGYAFRSEQATVTNLANWAKYDFAGDAQVSNFTIGATNPPGTGMLSGVGAAGGASAVDLTVEGTDDWAHWGYSGTGIDHKSVSGSAVNHITETHVGSPQQYFDNANGYSWTDGTPTANAVASKTGVYIVGTGNSFTITVPADTSTRTVKLYVGGWKSAGTLTAHLSDNSAMDYTDSSFSNNAVSYYTVYTITYKAGAAGQNMTATWQAASTQSGGNVTLQAVTLQGGSAVAETIRFVQAGISAGSPGCWFNWCGTPGATNSFKVYRCTNLMAGNWQLVAPNVARSGNGTNLWTDTNVFQRAFYRVAVPAQ
jgi:hypothetical protein